MTEGPFVSTFKPMFDDLVRAPLTPADAVRRAIEFQRERDLGTPPIYVSTAITSAGYRRDPSLDFPEVIRLNNEAAASLLTALHDGSAPCIHPDEVMVPTELGKVPGWKDSHYLIFYFCWLSGLGAEATGWVEGRMADAVLAPTLSIADARERSNAERWPHYENFVNVLMTHLAVASARRKGKVGEACMAMLQLVDVEESLGCRAEELFAEVAGLDLLTFTCDSALNGSVAEHAARLGQIGAKLGTPRRPVQLAPLVLR